MIDPLEAQERLRRAVTSATICNGMYATDQMLVDAIVEVIRAEVAALLVLDDLR